MATLPLLIPISRFSNIYFLSYTFFVFVRLFLHAGCLLNIYRRILSFLEDEVSDVTSSFSKKRKLMRISLSRSPKIIEAITPFLSLPSSHSARQKKLRSSQSGCTEPTRRDRKSSQSSGRSGWRPADFARTHGPGSRVHPHT